MSGSLKKSEAHEETPKWALFGVEPESTDAECLITSSTACRREIRLSGPAGESPSEVVGRVGVELPGTPGSVTSGESLPDLPALLKFSLISRTFGLCCTRCRHKQRRIVAPGRVSKCTGRTHAAQMCFLEEKSAGTKENQA